MSLAIRLLVAAAAVAGVTVSGLMTAGAASATLDSPGTHGPGSGYLDLHTGSPAIGLAAAAPASTRSFAGYQTAVAAGSATVATASFTVPHLSCTSIDRAIAPSAGVPANNYQTASVAFLFTGCVNGRAVYFPGLTVNGTETDYTTTPFTSGDVINLTTKVSVNRTRVQVTDVTTGVTKMIIGTGARASAAYFGENGWFTSSASLLHVPDFGKLTFENCLIDGKALASWNPHAYQRVNTRGTVQIATGGAWPGGTAFTTHFQHT
jgi:hypothetical protein